MRFFKKRSLFVNILFAATFYLIAPKDILATDVLVAAGPVFEYNFYGEPGIMVSCTHAKILGGHPGVALSYTTSRASFWNGPYALKTDNVLATFFWNFRPQSMFDPFAGLDIGYSRFDREDDELFAFLDNNTLRLNLRTGIKGCFGEGHLVPSVEGGLAILTSSTVFPLFFRIGVAYVFGRSES